MADGRTPLSKKQQLKCSGEGYFWAPARNSGHGQLELWLLVYSVGSMGTLDLSREAKFRLVYRIVAVLPDMDTHLLEISAQINQILIIHLEQDVLLLAPLQAEPGAVSHNCSRSILAPHLLPPIKTIIDLILTTSVLFNDPCHCQVVKKKKKGKLNTW